MSSPRRPLRPPTASKRAAAPGGMSSSAFAALHAKIDRFPQLTPEEHDTLLELITAGRAAEARAADGSASHADRRDIARGRRAADDLTLSTARLVLLICREQSERRLGRERALEAQPELVAEAFVALAEAIATYDKALSPQFHTYAARKIRQRVAGQLNEVGGQFRVPAAWHRLRRVAMVRIPEMTSQLGRPPSDDEVRTMLLEACLEWAEDHLTETDQELTGKPRTEAKLAKLRKQGMLAAIDNFREVLGAAQNVASLDAPLSSDGDGTLADVVSGEHDEGFEAVYAEELRGDITAAIASLDERSQRILRCRYGFVDGEIWTYPRIAVEFGVSAERVRQIEAGVITRLRESHEDLRTHLPSQ